MRHSLSDGTLILYEKISIESPTTVTLPNLQAMVFTYPDATPLAGKTFYYGVSDLNSQGGIVSFNTHGPATISGQNVSFAQVPMPITYVANHTYTFVVYATAEATSGVKIYVPNGNSIFTYHATDGTRTTPTITDAIHGASAVRVDAAGKIYVVNAANNTLTTYNPDGFPTTPTITAGLNGPVDLAVDGAGRIYVLNAGNCSPSFTGNVTTYDANGTQSGPTINISAPNYCPRAITVDAAGKIYVATGVSSTINTYKADGTPTTPTITEPGTYAPSGVAVDSSGKIYVSYADDGRVRTYKADGTPTTPTIYPPVPYYPSAGGIALDATGNLYVEIRANRSPDMILYTFRADGTRSSPTIDLNSTLYTHFAVR